MTRVKLNEYAGTLWPDEKGRTGTAFRDNIDFTPKPPDSSNYVRVEWDDGEVQDVVPHLLEEA